MFFRRKPPAPASLTLEGALGPNDRLDAAPAMAVTDPRAMCAVEGALLVSSGSDVLRYATWDAAPRLVQRLDAPVTALAASPGGRVAVAVGDRLFMLTGDRAVEWPLQGVTGISDLVFLEEDEIAVVDTGYAPRPADPCAGPVGPCRAGSGGCGPGQWSTAARGWAALPDRSFPFR